MIVGAAADSLVRIFRCKFLEKSKQAWKSLRRLNGARKRVAERRDLACPYCVDKSP